MNNSKKSLIAAFAALVAICAAWFVLLYKPNLNEMKLIEQKSEKLISSIQILKSNLKTMDGLEADVISLRQKIKQQHEKTIDRAGLQSAVNLLNKHGKKHGLRFNKILPDYESLMNEQALKITGTVVPFGLNLQMQGRYKNLGKFLETMKDLPILLSVKEFSIDYNEEVFPDLMLMVELQLFMRGGGTTEPVHLLQEDKNG